MPGKLSAMFRAIVESLRKIDCATCATLRCQSGAFADVSATPSTQTRPPVGWSRAMMMSPSVLLPAPVLPVSADHCAFRDFQINIGKGGFPSAPIGETDSFESDRFPKGQAAAALGHRMEGQSQHVDDLPHDRSTARCHGPASINRLDKRQGRCAKPECSKKCN